MIGKFFRIGLMLGSCTLAVRSFYIAYLAIFKAQETLSSEMGGIDVSEIPLETIALLQMSAPFDFLTGLFLIFWPFYLGWLEEKWRK